MKIYTRTTHYVEYRDLEKFINQEFGKVFEIVVMEEVGNDVSLTFEIDGKITDYEQSDFDAWIDGNDNALMFQTRVILNKFASVGLIPKGSYVVSVSW